MQKDSERKTRLAYLWYIHKNNIENIHKPQNTINVQNANILVRKHS